MEGINFMQYVEKSRNEYLELQSQLQEMATEYQRLKKQRRATEGTGVQAGEKWREMFKKARGKVDGEIRQLQTDEHAMKAEAQQLDELITELEPQLETLKVKTAGTRASYLSNLRRANQQYDRDRLKESADKLLATEEAQPFLAALADRLTHCEREALDDSAFMVTAGFDTPVHDGWYASIAHFPNDLQGDLRRKLAARENEMIADLVRRHLPEPSRDDRPEILKPIERLAIEAPEGSYKSGLAMKTRLQEIEQGKLSDEPDPRGHGWGHGQRVMRNLHIANAQGG